MQQPLLQYTRGNNNQYHKIQSKKSKLAKYVMVALFSFGLAVVVYKFSYPAEDNTEKININKLDEQVREMVTEMYDNKLPFDDNDLTKLTQYTQDCQKSYNSQFSQQGSKFSNIEYIGSGYDIFRADPLSKRADSGFRSNLYALNWDDVRQYSTGEWYPAELQVRREVACSASVSTRVMNDEKELQDSLKASVQIGGGAPYHGVEASFTASASFREASKSYGRNQNGRARAQASCSIYTSNIIIPPCMSQSLMKILNDMDTQPQEFQMNEFFHEFGTHSIKRLQFGGKFIAETEYNKLKRNTELQKGRDLAFSAEASGWGFQASAGASTSSDHHEGFKKDEEMGKGETWTIGSRLPKGTTVQDQLQNWIENQEQIESLALPINDKEIEPLTYTIKKSLKTRNQLAGDIDSKLQHLEKHLSNGGYCNYLKNKGLLPGCEAPNPRDRGQMPEKEKTYRFQWSNWGTKNGHGAPGAHINLEGKNYILVQEQANYGIVDVAFGVDGRNYARSTGNPNGKGIERPFTGHINGILMKEQYGRGVIDILFNYIDSNGNQQNTGWFTNNNSHNRIVQVNDFGPGSYATIFQASEQGGYGVVDARLGMQIPTN